MFLKNKILMYAGRDLRACTNVSSQIDAAENCSGIFVSDTGETDSKARQMEFYVLQICIYLHNSLFPAPEEKQFTLLVLKPYH